MVYIRLDCLWKSWHKSLSSIIISFGFRFNEACFDLSSLPNLKRWVFTMMVSCISLWRFWNSYYLITTINLVPKRMRVFNFFKTCTRSSVKPISGCFWVLPAYRPRFISPVIAPSAYIAGRYLDRVYPAPGQTAQSLKLVSATSCLAEHVRLSLFYSGLANNQQERESEFWIIRTKTAAAET